MGLLDQVMGGIGSGAGARKPGLGGTVAAGVILALVVKAARSLEANRQSPAAPQPANGAHEGGLGGAVGGLLRGGGLGGLLGSLGGAGALGALVNQLQQKGFSEQVNSWVGNGQNQPLAPHQLADALGPETVDELQQHTGMARDSLLQDLAATLPEAVHELTPAGRPPLDSELHQIAAGSAAP